jgi:hypothetical protein
LKIKENSRMGLRNGAVLRRFCVAA